MFDRTQRWAVGGRECISGAPVLELIVRGFALVAHFARLEEGLGLGAHCGRLSAVIWGVLATAEEGRNAAVIVFDVALVKIAVHLVLSIAG